MRWFLPRLLLALASMALGGLLGMVWAGQPGAVLGVFGGGLCAAGAIAIADRRRGSQLLAWLRAGQEGPAPRDSGLWGEIGYRIERALLAAKREALNEQSRLAQFLSAIEVSPNGVMLLDAQDQIEWLNSQAADHFGLDPERDRRQPITNLVRAPAFVAYMQAARFTEPVRFLSPRGRALLSVLARPYADGMKLVISTDRTEEERNESMRRDFVANVSHEIRTPLTVLSGFLETMTNLPLSDAERKRILAMMSQQTARMESLVNDLLILAQLEGSPRPPADRWVDLKTVFAQVEAEGRALSVGRHTLSLADVEGVNLAGEQTELVSAITNLVNNAIRYTPEGGKIDVSWRLLADGRGEVAVTDTGRGIAREHLPRLTERFYRVDSSRSRETGGTGLGLSIVKHVVQRHGGELSIESEVQKGSTFKLLFPAGRIRRAGISEPEPPALAMH